MAHYSPEALIKTFRESPPPSDPMVQRIRDFRQAAYPEEFTEETPT